MKTINYLARLSILLGVVLFSHQIIAQSTIAGTISDEAGEPLIGANIVVKNTTEGTTSEFDGSFSLTTNSSFPVVLVASFTGFNTEEFSVDAPTTSLALVLSEGILIGEEVVVSASRRREKVQEAPASVSVLSARKLEATPNIDAPRNLINLPGVQIQQQSAARINIALRAGAGLFGTSAFPIMDYRSLVGPGIGTFDVLNSPINNIDLAQIEVVRGPGSALYGPGVTSGVVHFITKNPIDFPGTTVELIGGELSTYGASIRHAGVGENKKFGYKINASYKTGGEFTLDPVVDAAQIARFQTQIVQPGVSNGVVDATLPATTLLTQQDLDPDMDGNPMQDDWSNAQINGTLEFRPNANTTFSVTGGYNTASAVFYNSQGEGLSQAKEFYGQARIQSGGFFAQAFYVDNDGGGQDRPTFLYQTGNRTPVGRQQIEAQVQYNFDTPDFLNASWTVGADYRQSISDTENLVYGRNEDDDDYNLYGGYVQGKFGLGDYFDLVLAGRYDQFNFIDEGAFAPRAALVYKASPKHTFRATYNRAKSPNSSALQNNIDFPLATVIPGALDIWLYGNKTSQTFNNPMIDWTVPGLPSLPVGATQGFPLAFVYGAVTPAVLEGIAGAVGTLLTPDQFALLQALLTNPANAPTGSTGQLFGINLFNQTPLGILPAPETKIATEETFEIGYKGLFADKLGVTLDIWNRKSRDFSLFTAISPAYTLLNADFSGDLGSAVAGTLQPQLLNTLIALGVDPVTAGAQATAFAGLLGQAYSDAGAAFASQIATFLPGGAFPFIATTPTDNVPQDGATHIAAGYRGFDEIQYWGIDFGLEYFVSDDLSIFGNYSWLEENEFMPNPVDAEGASPLPFFLNAPTNKFRLGFLYTPQEGFRANLSFQHDPSFNSDLGQFSGPTDEKNVIDAGIGYKWDNGLSIDLTATNLFDNEYRAFPNMPMIGRRVLGKVTYTFGTDQ